MFASLKSNIGLTVLQPSADALVFLVFLFRRDADARAPYSAIGGIILEILVKGQQEVAIFINGTV